MSVTQEQLLDEQKSILGQLYEERRALADERAQFNLTQKLRIEQEQRESLKTMKVSDRVTKKCNFLVSFGRCTDSHNLVTGGSHLHHVLWFAFLIERMELTWKVVSGL